MGKIEITPGLIGNLSESYFKEYCEQRSWAYISLEQIHENGIKDGVLKFKQGFNRILIKLPEELIKEVEQISRPSNSSILKPTFVYDFLTCRVGQTNKDGILKVKNKRNFNWVEVKTGGRELTKNQIRTLKKITIPLFRFRVPNPLLSTEEVDIYSDKVDSKYLFEHGLDSKASIITKPYNSSKESRTSFKKVSPKKFPKIKQGLKKLFKVTPHQSDDPNVSERLEIVIIGAKFHVSYYKNGTLLIQGDESLEGFKQVIKFIKHALENDS